MQWNTKRLHKCAELTLKLSMCISAWCLNKKNIRYKNFVNSVLILAFEYVLNKINKSDPEPYFDVEVRDSDYFANFCFKLIEKIIKSSQYV